LGCGCILWVKMVSKAGISREMLDRAFVVQRAAIKARASTINNRVTVRSENGMKLRWLLNCIFAWHRKKSSPHQTLSLSPHQTLNHHTQFKCPTAYSLLGGCAMFQQRRWSLVWAKTRSTNRWNLLEFLPDCPRRTVFCGSYMPNTLIEDCDSVFGVLRGLAARKTGFTSS